MITGILRLVYFVYFGGHDVFLHNKKIIETKLCEEFRSSCLTKEEKLK